MSKLSMLRACHITIPKQNIILTVANLRTEYIKNTMSIHNLNRTIYKRKALQDITNAFEDETLSVQCQK